MTATGRSQWAAASADARFRLLLRICTVLIAGVTAASCGADDESRSSATTPPRVGVAGLEGRELDVAVIEGLLVAEPSATPNLCAALAESFPPRCSGASILVPDLEIGLIADTKTNEQEPVDERVVWTEEPIALTGHVEGDTLRLVSDPVGTREPALLVTAVAGPTCPVETVPPDPKCAARPVAGARIELRENDERLIETTTDALGAAVLFASEGDYEIVAGSVIGLVGHPEPEPVSAATGTTVVRLSYDTGIR